MKRLIVGLVVATMLVAMAAVPALAQNSRVLVTGVSPDGGSANVGAASNISATFNIRMTRSTINNKTFYLKQQGSSAVVPAQVSYRGTTKTATLNPDNDLAYGASYTAYVKGGRLGVKGANDQRLDGTTDATATFANARVSWTFSVAPPPPPDTTIDSGPSSLVNSRSASFSFSSSEANSSFECSLDDAPFELCTSPITVPDESLLADGQHNFRVRAINALGGADPTPDTWMWTVDTVAPAAPSAHLDANSNSGSQNDNITNWTVPRIKGTAEDASCVKVYDAQNNVLHCAQVGNDGTWSHTLGALTPDGTYSFTVKAIDAAGNESPGTSISLIIDTTAPETTLGDKPASLTSSTLATFTFSSSESNSTFECSRDDSAFAGCTSPKSYTGLADGSHTFSVRAIDAAGNFETTPVSYTWTVDTVGPNASITDGPPRYFNNLSASFALSGAEPGGGYVCRRDKVQPVSSEGTWSNCSARVSFEVETEGTYVLWVYAYDAAGNYGTAASRYWTVDTTAPTINLVSPTNSATGVAPSANVTATFSEAMISSSISDQAFTLVRHNADGTRTPVAASVSYNSSTRQATLDPRSDLASNTTYTATIKGGSIGVKDWSGNPLVQDHSWTFTIRTYIEVTPSPLDFTPGTSGCNTTITKTVTITNLNTSQVDLYPSVTNPNYSVASGVLHIPSGESLNLSISWTAPSSGFKITDRGRLELRDAEGNIMGRGDLTALINCGTDDGIHL